MLKHLEPLQISEEMLGAYLEGNLAADEVGYVESVLQNDELLKGIVDEVNSDGVDSVNNIVNTSACPDMDLIYDLHIPEIPAFTILTGEAILPTTPFYSDILACTSLEVNDAEGIDPPDVSDISIEQGGIKDFGADTDDSIIMNEDL